MEINNRVSTEIYYFSGTGNSLFISRELRKRIPNSKLIPIVSMLHLDEIITNANTVGFVFPVHALTIPLPVMKFLRKVDLGTAEYIFSVVTRQGIRFNDFGRIDKLLRKKKKRLNASFAINMLSNDVKDKHYKKPTEEAIQKIEAEALRKLDNIQEIILNKRSSREKDTDYLFDLPYIRPINTVLEKFVISIMTVSEYFGGVNYFYADEKCISCGICEKVCLSRKVRMINKRPLWQTKVLCYMCYACVNYCPMKAVQINSIPGVESFTKQNDRYTHPYATAEDIEQEKG